MATDVKLLQSPKAKLPIEATEFGIIIVVKAVQPLKHYSQ